MKNKASEKTIARLLAVQSLYGRDIAGSYSNEDEENELLAIYRGDSGKANMDKALFRKIISGVEEHNEELDKKIENFLEKGWNMPKLNAVLRSLLRAAVLEITYFENIPTSVIINEYVDIAGSFFDESDSGEVGFANAILDKIAKTVRAA